MTRPGDLTNDPLVDELLAAAPTGLNPDQVELLRDLLLYAEGRRLSPAAQRRKVSRVRRLHRLRAKAHKARRQSDP